MRDHFLPCCGSAKGPKGSRLGPGRKLIKRSRVKDLARFILFSEMFLGTAKSIVFVARYHPPLFKVSALFSHLLVGSLVLVDQPLQHTTSVAHFPRFPASP